MERMEIGTLLARSMARILKLKGTCKIQRDYELKMKKLECLLFEVDFILTVFEEFENPKEIEVI